MGHGSGNIWTPITFTGSSSGDIEATIGYVSGDLGALCTSGNINSNSFNKPFSAPLNSGAGSQHQLTSAQRRQYNFGWSNLRGGQTYLYAMLNAKTTSATWTYSRPTGNIGVSPYRALDFDGYNHNAQTPFKVSLSTNSVTTAGSVKITFDEWAEMHDYLYSWAIFNKANNLNMGIGCAVSSSAGSPNFSSGSAWYLLAGTQLGTRSWADLDNEQVTPRLSAEVLADIASSYSLPQTLYLYIFVIGDTTGITGTPLGSLALKVNGMSQGDIMLLNEPACALTLSQDDPTAGYEISLGSGASVQGHDIGSYFTNFYIPVTFTRPASGSTNITATAVIQDTATYPGAPHSAYHDVQIGDTTYNGSRVITNTATQFYYLWYDPGNEFVNINVTMSVVIGGRTYTKSYVFEIPINYV